jgi:hypothetical protein
MAATGNQTPDQTFDAAVDTHFAFLARARRELAEMRAEVEAIAAKVEARGL